MDLARSDIFVRVRTDNVGTTGTVMHNRAPAAVKRKRSTNVCFKQEEDLTLSLSEKITLYVSKGGLC